MRVVYEAENLIDAHLVRGRLESEGIAAFVRGEFLTGALGELPVSGLVAVCVSEPAEARARELIAQWRREQQDAAPIDDDLKDPLAPIGKFVA